MTDIACYQVDAFTRRAFAGNPAAVCPLDAWLSDEVMQAIAAENALSETAFFVPRERGAGDFELRWFTPRVEVDLCGHATLATALVLMRVLDPGRREARFFTKSGALVVTREGDAFTLDFPVRRASPREADPRVAEALGAEPAELLQTRALVALLQTRVLVVVLASAAEVRALQPDMRKLAQLEARAVMVTAKGSGDDGDVDFVSRFFAPKEGIDEDPVTGGAHCTLTPYWAEKLGKTALKARQVSARSGELTCELAGDRVRLTGYGVLVKSGAFHLHGGIFTAAGAADCSPRG